jgi:lysylphosphatidylglycerol synthetase-like protein (DUF2156 family)
MKKCPRCLSDLSIRQGGSFNKCSNCLTRQGKFIIFTPINKGHLFWRIEENICVFYGDPFGNKSKKIILPWLPFNIAEYRLQNLLLLV